MPKNISSLVQLPQAFEKAVLRAANLSSAK